MTRQFIMNTLGIQENDPRVPLLHVLNINHNEVQIDDNHNEVQIDDNALFRIVDQSSVNASFLEPLVNHLSAHPQDDEHNESILKFLYFTIILQRNAVGTDPELLLINPRNKLARIEKKLFRFLTTALRREDPDLVQKYVDIVTGLVRCIGIKVPQALLVQLMENTVNHYTMSVATEEATEKARALATSELLIIVELLSNALYISRNDDITYDANVASFHRRLVLLAPVADERYLPEALSRLDELRSRNSRGDALATYSIMNNTTPRRDDPPSSSSRHYNRFGGGYESQ